jgi:hypothetical protein
MRRLLAAIRGDPSTRRLASGTLLGVAVLTLAAAGGAAAGLDERDASGARPGGDHQLVLRVAHGPVTTSNSQYIDAAPSGSSPGDVRTYYLPLTRPGSTREIGYLTGTLTTTATDRPDSGMELRTADLVFVVGSAENQIVVGGVGAYARTASTLSKRTVTTRPVVGGSGAYAGARGWCVSTHLADDTWTHVFHVTVMR